MTKHKFQMTAGQHIGIDPTTGKERKYVAGDMIDTDIDLGKKFNLQGFPPKFVEVGFGQQQQVIERVVEKEVHRVVDLGSMPFNELVKFAEEEEIDLKGAKTQQDALKAIRATSQQATK